MTVKIRMKRMGRTNRPFYRICATDSRVPRDGRVIEELGTYDPMVSETDARVVLDGERVAHWLAAGAQASPKVSVLIRKYGKDGTHLDQQQQALNRLAARKANAVSRAQEAARLAAVEEKKRREEAESLRKAEQAAADAAAQAQAAEAAQAAQASNTAAPAVDEPAAEAPAAEPTRET